MKKSINKKVIIFSFFSLLIAGLILNINSKESQKEEAPLHIQKKQSSEHHTPNLTRQPRTTLNIKQKNTSSNKKKLSETEEHADTTQREIWIARKKEIAQRNTCPDSTVSEVGYITEAYNQNTMGLQDANLQIIHQMQTCNSTQINEIISKLFSDSDNATHSMALLLNLLPQVQRSFSLVNAISIQNFNNDEMQDLINFTKDEPTGIKQALVPSIVKNDSLENLLALTQQDNFFSSLQTRTGNYPEKEDANRMVLDLILSQRHNIQSDGAIFNHLLEAYPNSNTQNALTKVAFTTN